MPQRRLLVFVLVVLAVLAIFGNVAWVRLGRPVALVDAPVKRIACVSYAPYRKPGETPFDPAAHVARARIDEDLTALSRRFDCVRTYSVGQGLDAVPEVARRHGMKVLLGIWLSRNARDNEVELARGIAVANANRDVIRAVIVGNEVLLRGELPQEKLAEDIRRVGQATGLPVTYADVWEFWLKYPAVAPAVSFLTIHILPYWEDEPVAVEDAVAHVAAIRERIARAFPGRDILIGETGWPSAGRQRRGAIPSLVNQARFIREFLNWTTTHAVAYNVIEAFDQPWKRQLEGTVGGYWGLYDDALREKFPLLGPVIEEPRWQDGVEAGALGGLFLLLAGVASGLRAYAGLAVLAVGGDAAGCVLWGQWRHIEVANRNLAEWTLTLGLTAAAILTAALLLSVLARWAARPEDGVPAARAWGGRAPRSGEGLGWLIGRLRFLWLFAAVVMDVLLVFDARYRDFPTLLFAAPLAGFILYAAVGGRIIGDALEERWCAWTLVGAGLIVLVLERPENGSADLWLGLTALFALSLEYSCRLALRAGEH